jgi:Immunity protein 52
MWPVVILGQLKHRPEGPDALAARLSSFLARLVELDPLFSGWVRGGMRHRSTVPRLVTLPPDAAELCAWIAENPCFSSREKRKQHVGYFISAGTPVSNSFRVDFCLDTIPSGHWLRHRTRIVVSEGALPPDKTAIEALNKVLRDALIILGTAWECDWAGLMPGDFRSYEERASELRVKYESGWMVYLDQTPARRLGELRDIKIETLPNNAVLLTAVSDAKFDHDTPVHAAAATRIQAALAPLNERCDESAED